MKKSSYNACRVFLAVLIVGLFSCTNPANGKLSLIGSGENLSNEYKDKAGSQKQDSQSNQQSVPNVDTDKNQSQNPDSHSISPGIQYEDTAYIF